MTLRHIAAAVLAAPLLAVPAQADPVDDAGAWVTTYPSTMFAGSAAVFPDGTAFAYLHLISNVTGIVKSSDFGRTWTHLPPPPIDRAPRWGSPTTAYTAYGSQCSVRGCVNEVYITTDGARSWRKTKPLPPPARGTDRFFASDYTTSGRGRSFYLPANTSRPSPLCPPNTLTWGHWDVFVTRDHGESWRPYRLPAQGSVLHIEMFDERHGVLSMQEAVPLDERECWGEAASRRDTVWVTHDGARTWQRVFTCPNLCWNVAIGSPLDIYVAERSAVVYASHDGGRSFQETRLVPGMRPEITPANVLDVHFAKPRTGYAITFGLGIYRTTDGGATWLPEPSPVHSQVLGWHTITATGSRHALAIWPKGVLARISPDRGG